MNSTTYQYRPEGMVALRKRANLTRSEAARKSGITYAQLQRYETKAAPPVPNFIHLARVYGVPFDEAISAIIV